MSEVIGVGIADYKTTTSPNHLITLGLGSCIGVCIYDKHNKIGGLAHIMLPTAPKNQNSKSPIKYADTAIPIMVDEIIQKGANKNLLVAKIIGGANMFENINTCKTNTIGYKNQVAVKECLHKLEIPIVAEELGGNVGRTVILDLENLKVTVRFRGKTKEV